MWRVPHDSATCICFTYIDDNQHHLINSAKKNPTEQNKKSQKHTGNISRGLRKVSLAMVGQSDQFMSSPSRDRLHGAQDVPVPPSLLVIIIWPVAHSLWNFSSPTRESTCSTFFSLSKLCKSSFSQCGVWQTLMTHHSVLLLPCLFP